MHYLRMRSVICCVFYVENICTTATDVRVYHVHE
jgi:hypothetical protein